MAQTAAAKQALFDDSRRVDLFSCKSPIIHDMPNLSQHLDASGQTKMWICREDCNSGLAFGGNKVRKLEFVVPFAIKEGADTLVTTGGTQSNHMRQTAAVARKLGLKAVLIPKELVDAPGEEVDKYRTLGNIQLNSILGAETMQPGTEPEEAMEWLRRGGHKPYFIPVGASQHPTGGFGYARWALQLVEWEKENNVQFDAVVTACGGGSTLAGMVVGHRIAGVRRRLIGIAIKAESAGVVERLVLSISARTLKNLGLPVDTVSRQDFAIDDRFHCDAYGKYDERTVEAIKIVGRTEGILLDPVYTGKTMAALISGIRTGELEGCRNILFVHTGGQSVMSAYPSLR